MSSVCNGIYGHLRSLRARAASIVPESPLLMPHQREAAAWAVETIRHFGGAILADDVGMGKTRVAAAVAARTCDEDSTVEAIVPPGLVEKWQSTMQLFGVKARVCSRYRLWENHEDEPAALTIVDEAHFFRNPASRGWEALRARAKGRPVLLVTATPFWNRTRDVESLVRLFADDGAFRCSGAASVLNTFREGTGSDKAAIIGSVLLMRTRELTALGSGQIDRRTIEWRAGPVEQRLSALIDELRFPLMESSAHGALVRTFMKLRLSSSVEAMSASMDRQRRYLSRALLLAERGYHVSRSSIAISRETSLFQEMLFPGLFAGIDRTENVQSGELRLELERITEIDRVTTKIGGRCNDLHALLKARPGPTIVFTTATETARMLTDYLRRQGHATGMITSTGAEDHAGSTSRQSAIEAFTSGTVDLLVATDVVGEGYDLERARRIVHYDLPWSPVRMHQREGRAWRLDRRAAKIDAVAFRVTGLGASVDEVLRRKERELESLLARASTGGSADPDLCGDYRVVRIGGASGALLQMGGRVAGFDSSGRILSSPEQSDLLSETAHIGSASEPAKATFVKWLHTIQEGRRRLPPPDAARDPEPWPVSDADSAIIGN